MSPLTSSGTPAAGLPDRVRCPRCSALAAAGAAWCGQCLYDLRTPEPMLPPDPSSAQAPEASLPPAVELGELPEVQSPGGRHRRADGHVAPGPLVPVRPSTDAGPTGSLAEDPAALAQRTLESLLAVDPAAAGSVPGGGWVARLAEPGARLGVMIGGALAVTAAAFALFAVFGLVLG